MYCDYCYIFRSIINRSHQSFQCFFNRGCIHFDVQLSTCLQGRFPNSTYTLFICGRTGHTTVRVQLVLAYACAAYKQQCMHIRIFNMIVLICYAFYSQIRGMGGINTNPTPVVVRASPTRPVPTSRTALADRRASTARLAPVKTGPLTSNYQSVKSLNCERPN